MKAIIPVAGYGTRFLPATKAQPKEMLPVYDKPIIQYVVEEAVASGIEDIILVTGRHKRSIEDHFDKYYELEYNLQKAGKYNDLKKIRKISNLADICYVRQKKEKGLGATIKSFQRHIGDEPFALLLGDSITKSSTPCTKQLIDVYNKYNTSVISLKEVSAEKVEDYTIVNGKQFENNIYNISEPIEKPSKKNAPSKLAVMGRYILTQDIFDKIDETEVGIGYEIHLTDALRKMNSVYGFAFNGKTYDIGNRLEWLKTSIEFALDDDEFKDDLVDYMKSYI